PSKLPEPFGNVVLEAMAMKKPVIANAHGGCMEIVKDGTTGYLVEPNNAALMTKKLASLIKDPEKRKKMGLEGRRKVEEEFTLDKNKEAIVSLYKEILGEEII
ncbi:MAG TPA: glycosyltransferase family 4 protein, partial [Candidatus Moranbacteria bacterium]|nr:glycosyltransferase family 4 protein [Candidatus Moranbacteria bacterium]